MKEEKKSTNIDIKKILNKIVKFLKKLCVVLKKVFSLLVTKIKEISNKDNIKYISFSKNFGKDAAIYAGLKYSTGDYTCIIDSDLQQNPKYIISMYEHLNKNENIDQIAMVMKNRNKESLFCKISKKLFSRIFFNSFLFI